MNTCTRCPAPARWRDGDGRRAGKQLFGIRLGRRSRTFDEQGAPTRAVRDPVARHGGYLEGSATIW